jgi:HAE1 family hydrophobic/amphiphilic exporter-1
MSERGGFQISSWSIRNPVPVTVLFLALMLAGILAYGQVPIKNFPDVSFPTVTVTVSQSGAAPSEMESQVTRIIEDATSGISGVKHMTSTVTLGSSQTQVDFEVGSDPQKALDDVRSAVDRVRINLPQGIDPPLVQRVDFDALPIMYYAVSSDRMSSTELSWFIDNTVARAIQGVKGVGQVTRTGGLDREINVLLDPARMSALGVTAPQINSALRAYTDDASGGRAEVGGRELTVRVLGGARNVEQLRELQIPVNGRYVRLGDVAQVGDGAGEQRGFSRLNDQPVAAFQISKTKKASEVDTEDRVLKAVAELEKAHPDVHFTKVLSTVDETRGSYGSTVDVLLEGMVLAALVVFLFLRDWRSTIIAAVAMPLSLVPTFAAMLLFGFSLNVVTLLSLTLVIGILVDDAIVEVENIQKRIERGARPYQAAIDGADAIGLAVVATTFTIVMVFTPVSMLQSQVGQFFREFGVTVAVAVLFSLLVARLLTPLMAAYFLSPSHHPHAPKPLPRFYQKSLDWALTHRWLAAALGGAFFVGSIVLAGTLPQGFQPTGNENYIYYGIQGQPGATRDDMARASTEATRILRQRPEVDFVFTQVGGTGAGADLTTGRIIAILHPKRSLHTSAVKDVLRPPLRSVADARITAQGANGNVADVETILAGANPDALNQAQMALLRQMRDVSFVQEPRPAPPAAAAELIIRPLPDEAARLNVSTDAIAQIARVATLGDIDANVAKFSEGDRRLPIRVRLSEADRTNLDVIRQLPVPTVDGKTTPLETVAEVTFEAGPGKIVRYDRERRASVEADLRAGSTVGQANSAIAKLPIMKNLPPGVRQAENQNDESMKELFTGIIGAMLAGVALIYGVLVLLFKSFFKPATILSALPLCLGGAFIALAVTQKALDMPVMIGLLMLLGVAAKNSILLVEFAIEAERAGHDRFEALQQACRERSRPIVMTTVAMIAGMAPTALGFGVGAEWRQPMAIAVIGGLISSTALSLILVPVVYEFVDDFEQWLRPKLGRLVTPRDPPLQPAPEDRL